VATSTEVLVRIDAVAICATDLEIIRHGLPASIEGELPFHKGYTPGHEYMGTVVKLGPSVDEYRLGSDRSRDPRGVRPLPALPRGNVYILPELRFSQ
jgi:threonine dehydrogenase-like Zn-dependent dehydrogenase